MVLMPSPSPKSGIFLALAQSPALREVRAAFRKATGLSLQLLPSQSLPRRCHRSDAPHPFCALLRGNASACLACGEAHLALQRGLERKLRPQEIRCFTGLTELGVPVVVGGIHVATLVCGPVLRARPRRREFLRLAEQLRAWGMRANRVRLERLYYQTPITSGARFAGTRRLLTILATFLAENASRRMLAAQSAEPKSIRQAKRYVGTHLTERPRLAEVARHVQLSRHHFCRVFKRGTGMTFSEYVARARVERAKTLLGQSWWSVTEAAGRSGFDSISQFNRTFRRYAGLTPTAYRASLAAVSRPSPQNPRSESKSTRSAPPCLP